MAAAMAVFLVPRLSASAAAAYQAKTYPEAAATYAGEHFPGQRLYTIDTWGGYLAYRFPTGRVVFLYDEPAVFGNSALQLYDSIDQLDPNWIHVLTSEGIQHAILPSDAREAAALHVLGWTVNCYDPTSKSLVMSAPPSGSCPSPEWSGDPASRAFRTAEPRVRSDRRLRSGRRPTVRPRGPLPADRCAPRRPEPSPASFPSAPGRGHRARAVDRSRRRRRWQAWRHRRARHGLASAATSSSVAAHASRSSCPIERITACSA